MHILLRGSAAQRLRLASGLILFTFALTHFLNHAMGLVSLEAMGTVQEWRTVVTRSLPGMVLLAGALLVHVGLALGKLARRATLVTPGWESAQLLLGLAIPFSLLPHIVNTGLAHAVFDVNDGYPYELALLWPDKALEQSVLLLVVWVHACVGLHFWLRLTATYRRVFLPLFALAVLIPAAGLAGFTVAGREVRAALADPAFRDELQDVSNWPDAAAIDSLIAWSAMSRAAFYSLLGLALFAVAGRVVARRFERRIAIHYTGGGTVHTPTGPTLLEISRMHGIPHTSVCVGRGRCSTCRVRVVEGGEHLPPASGVEAKTLASIGAGAEVRLACQVRPEAPLRVTRLVKPGGLGASARAKAEAEGVERSLVVLFLDVRNFTGLSEDRLPYDVVFILNRLFATVGAQIAANDGWIDKYLGDGLMAVFGRDTSVEQGCRQAIAAARAIDLALETLNKELAGEIGAPLRVGMGIHVGPLVLGEIGHPETAAMTVIGTTVNAASRLEALCKEKRCQLVVSAAVAHLAGVDGALIEPEPVKVRGLSEPLHVVCIERARDLAGAGPMAPA